MPDITIHELDEDGNIAKVTEFSGVNNTATVYLNGQQHHIPLEMALYALNSPAAADVILNPDNTIVDEIEIKYEVNR